jgi:hypothetical protein
LLYETVVFYSSFTAVEPQNKISLAEGTSSR